MHIMNIQPIPPQYVNQVWPQIEVMLTRALEHAGGEYNIDQLRFMLVRGEHVLLVASAEDGIHGAASVSFEDFPAARVAFISAIGGRLIANQELFSQLVDWCKQNGATKIRGAAREAVARLWKQKFGFTQRYIIVEHEL